MRDGVGGHLAQGGRQGRAVPDVDPGLEPVDLVPERGGAGGEVAPGEPGGAGDEQPHEDARLATAS